MRSLAALLLAFVATACASYPGDITRETLSAQQQLALDNQTLGLSWRQHEDPAAVVVLVHGLNLDPSAMLDVQQLLFDADMDVLSLSLAGHGNALDDEARLLQFNEATFADWQHDIGRAVQSAARRAAVLDRPLYLVGFSLGGLLSADYLVQNPGHGSDPGVGDIDRMVLLAPAISLKWSSYLLYPLQVFPDMYLPSVAPRIYRANDYAPVSAYLALYQGVNRFNELAGQPDGRLALNIPTRVFMQPRDELVSADGVRGFIAEHQLSQWQFIEIEKSGDAADVLNHLIIGPHSLGGDAWQSLSVQILNFLE
ncbi:alpha/beta hydrolase [Pseudohongiella sp.]|uniref:Serine aminopeptidase S33 domain-containing protein n=1 Tax=marine sediment metagenome TaxID=412755 RepID=A0A0F9W8T5_9ZZZZ|nr:alpha/beta fold hydrolase [Pseudohongiella sp.]